MRTVNTLLLSLQRTAAYLFLLLLCNITLCSNSMAQSRISLTTNGITGIDLFGSEHVTEKIATAIKTSDAATLLPYIVVVSNTGSLPITGLDVRYEIITSGDEVVNNFFYGSPDTLSDSGAFPIIAPGQTIVIGPNHLMNEQLMNGETLSLSGRQTISIARTASSLSKADRIKISIDSVIHSNGVLTGPDRSGTLLKFRQEITGYTEFRDQLLKLFSEGAPDTSIISWLTDTRDAKVTRSGKNQPLDRSVIIKKSLAQEYLAYMKQGRRQYALDTVKAELPELKLRRTIKVRKETQP